jgi:hypothetical protein
MMAAPALAQSTTIAVGVNDHSTVRSKVIVKKKYRPAYRSYASNRVIVTSSRPHCRLVTVRTQHANGNLTVRKIRRCS